eukprot:COSAG03_NODE_926_length_5290_cov_2.858216_2_plen_169_part_00
MPPSSGPGGRGGGRGGRGRGGGRGGRPAGLGADTRQRADEINNQQQMMAQPNQNLPPALARGQAGAGGPPLGYPQQQQVYPQQYGLPPQGYPPQQQYGAPPPQQYGYGAPPPMSGGYGGGFQQPMDPYGMPVAMQAGYPPQQQQGPPLATGPGAGRGRAGAKRAGRAR